METIESVLAQSYKNWELIIVDDGSTDETSELVHKYEQRDQRIRYYAQTKANSCVARNRGLHFAGGQYVKPLDSDDLLAKDALEKQVKTAMVNPDVIVFGSVQRFQTRDGEKILMDVMKKPTQSPNGGYDLLFEYIHSWWLPPIAFLWPRSILEKLQGWDEALYADEDGDLNMRAMLAGHKFMLTPEAWFYYRIGNVKPFKNGEIRDERTLKSRLRVVHKVKQSLELKRSFQQYQKAIAERYFHIGWGYIYFKSPLVRLCFKRFRRYYDCRCLKCLYTVYVQRSMLVVKVWGYLSEFKRRLMEKFPCQIQL